jgi:uncharacterized membrane protein
MPADPALLASIPFFQTLDDAERTAVAALMQDTRVAAGTTLFRQGDPGGVLYVIRSGRIELWVTDDDREKVVVDVLEPGEFFGELSLLDGGQRSTSATALEDAELIALAREPLLDLLRRRAEMALDMLAALGKRLRKADELLRRRVRNPNEVVEERETLGDRVADGVARFGGSWSFIFSFAALLLFWVLSNTVLVFLRQRDGQPFDPYPFILLNLLLSMVAAMQAPVIMMSQNRQDRKDRIRADLEYQVNVRAEYGVQQLLEKLDALERRLARHDERVERDGEPRPPAV